MPDDGKILEMAFERRLAEARVRGKEETINLHVAKILAFDVGEATRECWRKEIRAETALIARLAVRIGKGVRRLRPDELLRLLYREPFEANEVAYTAALLDAAEAKAEQAGQPLLRNGRGLAEIAEGIAAFHNALAPMLAAGDNGWAAIEALGPAVPV